MARGMPWFRMFADFMTDWRIEALAFEDQRHFVFLLCAKCAGYLDEDYPNATIRDRAIGRRLGLQGEALDNAKARLLEVGLIDDAWQPVKWEQRQAPSDSSTNRVREYRARQAAKDGAAKDPKQPAIPGNPSPEQDETVTETVSGRDGNGLDRDREGDLDLDPAPNGAVPDANAPGLDRCPIGKIVDLYHEALPNAPRVVRVTPARAAQIRARWQQGNRDLGEWRGFFEYVAQSPFLTGQSQPRPGSARPFVADLEWLVKEANWVKVIEGRYHG